MSIDVERNIEAIFSLTPMQQGMLFHTLYGAEEQLYFEQVCWVIRGDLNAPALRRAWQHVVDKYDALRTAFVWEGLDEPLQVVGRDVQLPWEQLDWRGIAAGEQRAQLERFMAADRLRGFDFASAPLMRQALIRFADDQYWFVSSHHHILMDGWSVGIVFQEALESYAALCCGEALSAHRPRSYQDYIAWIERQDQAEVEAFWRETLKGFTSSITLPIDRGADRLGAAPAEYREQRIVLSPASTTALQAFARQQQLTLNTLAQGAWALLLSRYSGADDVVFGATVSGRPADLPGVETTVGLFINTLPVRACIRSGQRLGAWLKEFQAQQVAARQYEYSSLMQIQKWSDLPPGTPLFESIFVFENFPMDKDALAARYGGSEFDVLDSFEQINFPLKMEVRPGTELKLQITYDARRFDAASIAALLGHYRTLLEAMAEHPATALERLPLLPDAERQHILVEWNATAVDYPRYAALHQLFEAQVERTPESVAVVFEQQRLTYRELNARANQLAHYLRGLGVGPDTLVGVYAERSLEMVIALYGILKAGGAYLPLDPSYPPDRLAFMLEDARPVVLLTHQEPRTKNQEPTSPDSGRVPSGWFSVLGSGYPVVDLVRDWPLIADQPDTTPANIATPDNLAYVIYTSGSTGRPKGVMVPHSGIINRLLWMQEEYQLTAADRVLQKTPFSFDVSVWEFFWPLLAGARLVVARPEGHKDSAYLVELIQAAGITTLHFVPPMLQAFLDAPGVSDCTSLRQVICSGEALPYELQQRFFARMAATELHNLYGPTEASVDVTYWACRRADPRPIVPIGLPVANTQMYVLDRQLQAVPVGVLGDLYIGGVQLARGYLARPDLTADRFIPNPFATTTDDRRPTTDAYSPAHPLTRSPAQDSGRWSAVGGRLYKTGDLARYLPDGSIEYQGRSDHQVKIRGFRIELGEIEAALARHPGVHEVVVLAREDVPGVKRLVAYLVPSQEPRTKNQEPNDLDSGSRFSVLGSQVLRDSLKDKLPDYMVPTAFVMLDALPLSPNGKVDRKALPAPDLVRPDQERATVAPRTVIEAQLAEIWAEVLRTASVGIHDNFFELGGDSILSLQIIARAGAVGLRLTPRQIFQHRTIAELAAAIDTTPAATPSAPDVLDGAVPLTPIQRWFFAQEQPQAHHWNQAVLLVVRQALPEALLRQAIGRLLEHHDGLRLRFTRAETGWRQHYAENDPALAFERIDLALEPDPARVLEAIAAERQAGLDLERGPLARFVLFDQGTGRPARLLIAIHHLVVDGVSWRILLEDLETICRALGRGEVPVLPPKTTSYKRWAERLADYARSAELGGEAGYWQTTAESGAARLPADFEAAAGANTVASERTLSIALDAEETRALLQDVPRAYRTQINDVLLTALALTFARQTGTRALLVDLEGHGREDLFDDVDLSRTVGWFTTIFPVALDLGATSGPAQALKAIKEQLRRVPRGGIGYGLLRYLTPASAAEPQAAIRFNYLGQFSLDTSGASIFGPAAEESGPERSPLGLRSHDLDVTGVVSAGSLTITWAYSENLHRRATIERLARTFAEVLRELIAHCRSDAAGGYTPSDFPLATLDQAQLDRLLQSPYPIEDIYPLSPTQQGMLFHSLYAPQSGAYFEQLSLVFAGALDNAAFERAWRRTIERHPVLRTAFAWENLAEPLQIVYRQIDLPLARHDWRDLPAAEQAGRLDAFLRADQAQGFALAGEVPLRLALIRLADDAHRFILSSHHMLMDGWSVPVLVKEFLACYTAFCRGQEPGLEPSRPYRDYIAWLRAQDQSRLQAFWRGMLHDFTTPTPIGSPARPTEQPKPDEYGRQRVQLAEETSARLQTLARQHGLTLNTLVTGAWALLLSAYSRQDDIVFGVVVSGRPPALAGVESMVGMFINTLPIRTRIDETAGLWDWLRALQDRQSELREYEHSALVEVQGWSGVPRGLPLFESIFVFENYPVDQGILDRSQLLGIRDVDTVDQASFPLSVLAMPGTHMTLGMGYDRRRFEDGTIAHLLDAFRALLERIAAEPEQRLAALRPLVRLESPAQPRPALDEPAFAADLEAQSNLTRHQLLIWVGQKLQPESPLYNICLYFPLPLAVDVERFRRAFQLVVDRSDTLRTVIEEHAGIPQQRVRANVYYDMEFRDFSGAADPHATFEAFVRERSQTPFQLASRLFDAVLVKTGRAEFRWYIGIYHIISDGLSFPPIFNQLAAYYEQLAHGELAAAPASQSFQSYVEQERRDRDSERYLKARAYWQAKLAQPSEPLNFYGKPPRKQTSHVRRVGHELGAGASQRLRAIAKAMGGRTSEIALFNAFAAMLCVYLHKVSQSTRFSIGIPTHNRSKEYRDTIGFFMQIIPIQVSIEPGDTFMSLIDQIKEEMNAGLRNRQYVVDNPVNAPRFDVIFNYHKDYTFLFADQRIGYEWMHIGHDNASLSFQVRDTSASDNLQLDFDFHCDVFSDERQQQAIRHFDQIVAAFVADRTQPISQVGLLSSEEQQRILVEFNQYTQAFPSDQTFAQLFEAQVARTPNALAVIDTHERLTYAELNARANRMAWYLRSAGVGPEVLVALLAHRSVDLLTAILAVFKAGGAYLPLDPHHPPQRLRQVLSGSQSALILAAQEFAPALAAALEDRPAAERPPIAILEETPWSSWAAANPPTLNQAHNLAYVIYTSGSTGAPKGAMVEQVGMINHLYAKIADLDLTARDTIAQTASQCFDISVWQFLVALVLGGRVHIIDDETAHDPLGLFNLVERGGITILETVPSLLRAMLDGMARLDAPQPRLSALRWLVLTGEALPPELARQWLASYPDILLVNAYGPTECSDDVTHAFFYQAPPEDATTMPIGAAIANMNLYILDRHLQPLPVGMAGELYVGGIGVGRGYLGRPDLTAERFIPNPFYLEDRGWRMEDSSLDASEMPSSILHPPSSSRLYRTGDLARYLPDGSIEFLGRIDHQVKIRGFRIELGEIEAVLESHPQVHAAVVVARDDLPGQEYLAAYVVPNQEPRTKNQEPIHEESGSQFSVLGSGELRTFLKERLPEYMVPTMFMMLDALPLNSNGKVDRKALPAPEAQRAERTIVAPRNLLERQIVQIWEEVLGVRPIGVRDSFFELGGHSLLAVRLVWEMQQRLQTTLSLATLLQEPTIEQLAERLGQRAPGRSHSPIVAIQPGSSQRPFFCVHPGSGEIFEFSALARHLGPDQPFYGIRDPWMDQEEGQHPRSLEEIAAHYVAAVCEVQPSGPYMLGGHSFGGQVAFEMAQQLIRQGQEVALLAILDTKHPYGSRLADTADEAELLAAIASDLELPVTLADLRKLAPDEQVRYVLAQAQQSGAWTKDMDPEAVRRRLELFKERILTVVRYEPAPYQGQIVLFRAEQRDLETDAERVAAARQRAELLTTLPARRVPDLNGRAWGWEALAEDIVEVQVIPGNHATMLREPHVRTFAQILRATFEAVQYDLEPIA